MKKISIFLLLSFLILSCSNSDNDNSDSIETNQQTDLLKSLSKSDSNEIIKNLEKTIAPTLGQNISFEYSELRKINENYYLVSKHGDFITTTLLITKLNKSQNLELEFAGISCTSKACSNSNGCIPDSGGKKCTSCNFGTGDCTKTVSG